MTGHQPDGEVNLLTEALRYPPATTTDEDRYTVIETSFVIKPPRDPPNEQHWLDIATELLCQNLAQRLSLPVVPAELVVLPSYGPVMVSPYRGERTLSAISPGEIANPSQLTRLAVFEELVMNTDDKDQHFRAIEIGDGEFRVEVLDHGHTFHPWKNEITTPEEAASAVEVTQPSSDHLEYPEPAPGTLREAIEELQSLSDDFLEEILDETVTEVRQKLADDPSVEPFLDELDRHAEIWRIILRRRRDRLDAIMTQKYPQILDEEETQTVEPE